MTGPYDRTSHDAVQHGDAAAVAEDGFRSVLAQSLHVSVQYICLYAYIYIHICVYVYTYVQYIYTYICIYICHNVYMYSHMQIYVYTYIYVCICVMGKDIDDKYGHRHS